MAGICGLLLAMSLMNRQPVIAQQSPAQDSETAELRRRVHELEERLEKLEAQRATTNTAASAENVSLPSAKAPGSAETKPAEPDNSKSPDNANQQDSGFLDFFRKVEVSGFIDGYYSYNFNKPSGRTNVLRNFDTRNNEFALNLAELAFEKKPDADSRVGFRLDLDYGPATDMVHAAEPGGKETYKVIQQAYGSYLAPIGSGLQIDVGKFVTMHGAEVIETKDNWNYSRGLLFAWAIPYYHMGLRANYTFNSKARAMAMIVNGWNNVEENNGGKTYGFMLGLNPTPKLAIVQNYMFGPEQANDDQHKRNLSDTTITYTVNPKVALMANYDYGFDHLTAGGRVHWQGIATYLRFSPTKRVSFTPRFEFFDDHDGFSTGTAQRLKEFTATGEYRLRPNFITRFEYRTDWSNQAFFPKSDPAVFAKSQSTILAGMIWTFGTREQ